MKRQTRNASLSRVAVAQVVTELAADATLTTTTAADPSCRTLVLRLATGEAVAIRHTSTMR